MSRKILNRNTTVSSKGFGTDGLDSLLLKLFTVWNFEPGHFNEDATGQGHNANGVGSRPYLSEQDFGAI